MKNVAVLTGNGAFALFFRPTPGDLTAQHDFRSVIVDQDHLSGGVSWVTL